MCMIKLYIKSNVMVKVTGKLTVSWWIWRQTRRRARRWGSGFFERYSPVIIFAIRVCNEVAHVSVDDVVPDMVAQLRR